MVALIKKIKMKQVSQSFKKRSGIGFEIERKSMIGENMSFAAAEAYKRLRTNLEFSFSDSNKCRIIGITSALSGEGKSLTAINIAYTIAETGKKVLLLEADLRIPTIAEKLDLNMSPGLSNLLVRMNNIEGVVQKYSGLENLSIIVAGDNPPNPSELLGSDRMREIIEEIGNRFECVIVDLPPISIVSDALIISKLLHGIVVVVRHDYSDRSKLAETIRQLQFADARILGFLYNAYNDTQSGYGKKYRKKYKGYNNVQCNEEGEVPNG